MQSITEALAHQPKVQVHLEVDQGPEAKIKIKIKIKAVRATPNQMKNHLEVIAVLQDPAVLIKRKKNDDKNKF